MLLQAVHVPSCVGEEPARYWSTPHTGWLLQVPGWEPVAPERYCVPEQVVWAVHTVFVPPEQPPLLYCPVLQLLHAEQVASDVPEHPPVLYWPEEQAEHAGHVKPFVVPLQAPTR